MPIGAGAAIAIGLGTAGAGAAANIYATKKAGGINEKALEAQRQEGITAADIERDKLAYQEHARREAQTLDAARWHDYVEANRPSWQAGQHVFGNLLDLAGVARGGPAPFQMPTADTPPAGPPPPDWAPPSRQGRSSPSAGVSVRTPFGISSRGRAAFAQMPTPQAGGQSLYDLARLLARYGGTPTAGGPAPENLFDS